jgi:prephenate dehydrogenase
LIAGLLAADGLSVLAVDRSDPAIGDSRFDHVVGDALCPDTDLISRFDRAAIVVLAVPESVALAWSPSFAGPDTVVVETLSVKSGFAAKVASWPSRGGVLGINPMFAPSLGMQGRPVAAVAHRGSSAVEDFVRRVGSWGATVVQVDADRHDRLAAATQALTHGSGLAFGSALARLDIGDDLVDAVAPPPARTQLALLARITGGEPEVYWDVQAGNPYAAEARRALRDAVTELDDTVTTDVESEFTALLGRAASAVPDSDAYRALCGELFGIVRGTPGERGQG